MKMIDMMMTGMVVIITVIVLSLSTSALAPHIAAAMGELQGQSMMNGVLALGIWEVGCIVLHAAVSGFINQHLLLC
jgi:hypothetical protein